ncbi:putative transmembrane protein [Lysobacter dokdonensis DS-58]|uniref:Putative transmembrane protein n=1 Tax=Lysobacter dokdonensis DS-58 TaxID=1300345 RepID=A0A0A2WLD0_9GAMM|nr:YetF domain-containing protein [Lysobacter dokdonensis]KGQ19070.1 putative transmembrane protein [Lysobacter dokdonensis DS-58]
MFELSMPVWEYVRAVVVYVVLLGMIRISGKRTMGQFTPFDVLLIVLLGNAVQNALLGKDTSLLGGLLLAAVLITLNWTTGYVASRSRHAEQVIEGVPVVLARDGRLFEQVLRRELVSRNDFDEALRQAGEITLDDVHFAILETDGRISVVPKRKSASGDDELA